MGSPTMEQEKKTIEAMLAEADVIVGWNVLFDLKMLYGNGIDVPNAGARYCDLMRWFYDAYKRRTKTTDKSMRRLDNAAAYLGIEHSPHNATSDAAVLIPIWRWVLGDGEAM